MAASLATTKHHGPGEEEEEEASASTIADAEVTVVLSRRTPLRPFSFFSFYAPCSPISRYRLPFMESVDLLLSMRIVNRLYDLVMWGIGGYLIGVFSRYSPNDIRI